MNTTDLADLLGERNPAPASRCVRVAREVLETATQSGGLDAAFTPALRRAAAGMRVDPQVVDGSVIAGEIDAVADGRVEPLSRRFEQLRSRMGRLVSQLPMDGSATSRASSAF